jgi:DNA helicase II / ATP-dependent DNA helicase PcrA
VNKSSGSTRLNKEQEEAVKFGSGPLLIIAGAGTGKTTVITERIKYLILSKKAKASEILALTFTEKAAREMEERVDVALPYGYTQMWLMTFHAFCDKFLRSEALHAGFDPRYKLMTEAEAIQLLRQNLFKLNLNYFRPLGNPNKFISGLLQHFSRLQDEDISPSEYFSWANSKLQTTNAKLSNEDGIEVEKWKELANAYKAYDEIKVKESKFDFGDLIVKTLKVLRDRPNILAEYRRRFKYVLVDEFQDTNFAQNELIKLIAGPNLSNKKSGNITVVADDDQCLPPNTKISTLGKEIKIKDIKVGDKILTAVGKGHTSVTRVSRIFRNVRNTRFLTFKTEGGKRVEVTDNHKMFCFLPAHNDSKDWHFVYIMYHTSLGWRVGVTNNLPQRLRLERHADKIIGIGSYKTDEEARFFEAYYSAKYGVPTVAFTPRPLQAISGELLKRLFRDIDTKSNIARLAADLNIELDSPQFLVGAVTRGETRRVKINFEMCARNYRSKLSKNGFVGNPTVLHQVSLETSNVEILKMLIKAEINLVKAKKGMKVRKNFTDLKEAWAFAEKLQEITGGIFDKRFKVGRFNYQHLTSRIVPASHVFPGMYLPVVKGKQIVYEKVISRTEKTKKSETYDLEIEKTHNFIASGIVVHNSIYRFRGAAVSNVIQFRKSFPKTKVIVLTKNYRSTQEILDRSYKLIQFNNPDRLEVVEKINKKLVAKADLQSGADIKFIHADRVENEAELLAKEIRKLGSEDHYKWSDFAILVRANNHADPIVRSLGRHGIPLQFLGPGKLFKQAEVLDLISYLKVLYNFEDSGAFFRLLSNKHFDITGFEIAKVGNYARKYNLSMFEAAEKIEETGVTKETQEKVKILLKMIKKSLNLVKNDTAGQILYLFLEESGMLKSLLTPESSDAEKIAMNVSKFFDKLKSYEAEHEDSGVTAVVDWLNLSMELGESPLASDSDWTRVNAVNILTVHSSKGLEFPVVFLVNLVSQRFPSTDRRDQVPIPEELIKEILPVGDYHLEEERRLFYVGMTRARERLYFTAADYYGEGKREKKLSPFIFEALGDGVVNSEQQAASGEQLSFLSYKPQEALIPDTDSMPLPHVDYLSYSQIDTFKTCPLHYKLRYFYKLPTPPTASQSFGTTIHATLKEFYEEVSFGKKPSERFILSVFENNWIKEGYTSKKHEQDFILKGKDYLAGFLKHGFNSKITPVALEQPFIVPISSSVTNHRPLKIGGKIDRVDMLPDGTLEIIDYKTGATIPSQRDVDKNLQLSFYALAATKIPTAPFGVVPEKVKLSLYFLDTQEKISTTRTQKQLEEAEGEIFKVRDEIEKSEFKCSGHMFCKTGCEFSLFCEANE